MATIKFTTPLPNAMYKNGDSITFVAQAISTAMMHGYDLAIRKVGEPSNIYFIHVHNHNDTLDIIEKWKSEVVAVPASLEAEIAVYIDHENHTKKEKIRFVIQ
ncbi:MAG: hypothetical protein EOO43_25515 [Flavobacterium sp.]|nr:MAG: hypothetical protein EOO43_25515 [Flavobacterium sp.]